MPIVSIHNAKTNLSRLIQRVLAGEDVVIERDAKPVVRLVRTGIAVSVSKKPLLGAMKGRMGDIGDEALAPLLDEYLGLDLRSDKPL
ncbi:antitoxin (DNA-binding transcriptional repressor) of toxin-antitoxin stability system [Sphingomonas sp. PvP055]|uniref:type II toxin-antitoxin system Phd/YefM family antitoxin n=1 Tax=Sphingomonas sp. PvP055 TaxID=3156391 RepID=UPI00339250C6